MRHNNACPNEQWVARNGTSLLLREGCLDDVDQLLEFERRLSPGTRYFRFGKLRDMNFSREDMQPILDPDNSDHLHYLVIENDGHQNAVLASGRILTADPSRGSELMIVVRDDWQRCGIGGRLIAALLRDARQRGLLRLFCLVLPTNAGMQTFMGRCGFNRVKNPESDVLLRFEISLEY